MLVITIRTRGRVLEERRTSRSEESIYRGKKALNM